MLSLTHYEVRIPGNRAFKNPIIVRVVGDGANRARWLDQCGDFSNELQLRHDVPLRPFQIRAQHLGQFPKDCREVRNVNSWRSALRHNSKGTPRVLARCQESVPERGEFRDETGTS